MSQVPPMLWFLFWVGLATGVLSFGFFMAIIIHRGNMKERATRAVAGFFRSLGAGLAKIWRR